MRRGDFVAFVRTLPWRAGDASDETCEIRDGRGRLVAVVHSSTEEFACGPRDVAETICDAINTPIRWAHGDGTEDVLWVEDRDGKVHAVPGLGWGRAAAKGRSHPDTAL